MAYNKTSLAKMIHLKAGLTLKEFCEQHLKSEYKTFQMRMRKRKYYPSEVIYICWFLGTPCEQIFGYSYWDLVMYQGKNDVPAKIRDMWAQADIHERSRLLYLIGMQSKVTHIDSKTPVVKAPPKQQEEPGFDFFEEIELKPIQAPEQRAAVPKEEDPLRGLFIETY